MDRIKLASHVKKGDTLYTPYTEPDGLGKALKITSWSKKLVARVYVDWINNK